MRAATQVPLSRGARLGTALLLSAILSILLLPATVSAQTLWCGSPTPVPNPPPDPPPCNSGTDRGCCYRSPCSVKHVNYQFSVTDLSIAAPHLPLTVTRSYDSRRGLDGWLGVGWLPQHGGATVWASLPPLIGYDIPRTVSVRWPDGRTTGFQIRWDAVTYPPRPIGNGGFWIAGVLASLTYDPATLTWTARVEGADEYFTYDRNFRATGGGLRTQSGARLNYTVDGTGRLTRIQNPAAPSRRIDFGYGADGRIASATDHTGRSVFYSYTGTGHLSTVRNPAGHVTTYSYYDTTHRGMHVLSRITDHWGRVITDITYLTRTWYVSSYTERGETFTYGTDWRSQATKRDSSNRTWSYTYDWAGRVTSERSPSGHTKTTTYDTDGRITSTTDERGIKTEYTYSGMEPRVLLARHLDVGGPQAVRFDYTYDAGFPEEIATITPKRPSDNTLDPHWQGWAYEYWPVGSNGAGQVRHVYRVRNDGVTHDRLATYTYNAAGQVMTVEDGDGVTSAYGYNPDGDLTSLTLEPNSDSGPARVYQYGRDSLGRLASVTNPSGHGTTYTYDSLDRTTSVTLPKPSASFPNAFVTTFTYDLFDPATGLVYTHQTDPNGVISKSAHDQFGRRVRSVDGLGGVTRFEYDRGKLFRVIDAHNYETTYDHQRYDPAGRLSEVIFPDGARENYRYGPTGLMTWYQERRDQRHLLQYDRLNRLVQLARGWDPNYETVNYDYTGQLLTSTRHTVGNETHSYTYDSAYQLSTDTQAGRGSITYTYTPGGRLASYSVQGGAAATYSYYPDGSVRTIQWSLAAQPVRYEYTADGRYATITLPNGLRRTYSYDDQGRRTAVSNRSASGATLAHYAYGYDLNHATGLLDRKGQRVSMTATVPAQGWANQQTKYEYDRLYQLTKTAYPAVQPFNGEVHSWSYDALGNRLTSTVNGSTRTYTYQRLGANPENWQRLLNDGTSSFTYDTNGNTTIRTGGLGSDTLTWDASNQLVSLSGTTTAGYTYDYAGRRTAKDLGGEVTTYLYDGDHVIREAGAMPVDYLYGPGIDEPLATARGGQLFYYLVDTLGSVTALTNSAGSVQDTYAYDAWGVILGRTGNTGNPLLYTARETAEAGALYYRARFYQPAIGRFLSEDILRRFVPMSPYAYPPNNPIRWRDPMGLQAMPDDPFADDPNLNEFQEWVQCVRWYNDRYREDVDRCRTDYDGCRRGCEPPRCPEDWEAGPRYPSPIELAQNGFCLVGCGLRNSNCRLGASSGWAAGQWACGAQYWEDTAPPDDGEIPELDPGANPPGRSPGRRRGRR